jgi:NAD(P)-dependent dehydrogenase (short-subunit alcohol dehydrogenase family)
LNLEGTVSFITGGTRGIGAATAIELARQRGDIAINGRVVDEQARKVQAEVAKAGRRSLVIPADLSAPDAAARAIDTVVQRFGRLDVLVHCAGDAPRGSLLEGSEDIWYRTFALHVHAAFHLCRAAAAVMTQQRQGAIVLIGSAAGVRGYSGAIAYAVAKGVLPQFTRLLARELAPQNIRVNCVSPGVTRTRLQDSLTAEQVKHNLEKRIPLHREGTSKEIAQIIAMLIRNDFITGENVRIDGGMTMRLP